MRLAPVHAAKKPWWRTAHRRQVSDEIMYLLTQGPLVIKPDERLFALELCRKHQSQPRRWPTQHQWAAFFGVDLQTVVRWVRHLKEARMVTFHRPYNVPNGTGGFRRGFQPSGRYELHPPSAWKYRNDWIYRGERDGWVTPDGEIVTFPPDVFSFPEQPETTGR